MGCGCKKGKKPLIKPKIKSSRGTPIPRPRLRPRSK